MDYQAIIDLIGEAVQIALPLGIIIGVIERLMDMIIKAGTGKGG